VDYVALTVAIEASDDRTAPGAADAFRRAADALTAALGESMLMGAYGRLGPSDDPSPSWGSPFRRWRSESNSLELKAGEHGLELVLYPTDSIESWHARRGKESSPEEPLGGFLGSNSDPANDGFEYPEGVWIDDWDLFAATVARTLTTLPAETRALGIELVIEIQSTTPFGAAGAWRRHLGCDSVVELSLFGFDDALLPDSALAATLGALGWTSVSITPQAIPASYEDARATYHSPAYGAGEVDGPVLARQLMDTLRLLGVEAPETLLHDGSRPHDGLGQRSARSGSAVLAAVPPPSAPALLRRSERP
jgi:hypothetical protein